MIDYKQSRHSQDILGFYVLSSLVFSIFVVGFYFIGNNNFLSKGFFPILLLISNYLFFANYKGDSTFFKQGHSYPILLLIQMVSFVGISFTYGDSGVLYHSMIPVFFGLYYFSYRERKFGDKLRKKGLVLFSITICCYLFFYAITEKSLIDMRSGIQLVMFLGWALSIIYFSEYKRRSSRFNRLKEVDGKKIHVTYEQKERLFYHDLINQTHGLTLFLNQRIGNRIGLSLEECKTVRDEVAAIQALVKDHFKYDHKDLGVTLNVVTFDSARDSLTHIVENYLPERFINSTFNYSGDLVSEDEQRRGECLVHFPSFNRIVTNLVKNISEVKTTEVHFHFNYDQTGLMIEIKNRIFNEDHHETNISNLILDKNAERKINKDSGLGLESVSMICKENGGSFNFSLEGDYWVNRVFLPKPKAHEDIYKKSVA